MFRRVVLACSIMAMLAEVNLASADIIKIDIATVVGASSIFDANSAGSMLAWTGGAGAVIYLDSGEEIYFDGASVAAEFTGFTDNSTNEIASAKFAHGSWSVVMKDGEDNPVLTMTGITRWFDEFEQGTDALHGRGIISVTSYEVNDNNFFIDNYGCNAPEWGGGLGANNGITSETTGLFPTNIQNYGTSFSGSNVTINVWADPSNIPEPATLVLLLGGGLSLLGRRTKRA
jgi:hypothetical protein